MTDNDVIEPMPVARYQRKVLNRLTIIAAMLVLTFAAGALVAGYTIKQYYDVASAMDDASATRDSAAYQSCIDDNSKTFDQCQAMQG